jgi:hypothetical protein
MSRLNDMSKRREVEKKDKQSRPKTESQRRQKGAASVSSRHVEKHEKDESTGAKGNTTKKQQNSI